MTITITLFAKSMGLLEESACLRPLDWMQAVFTVENKFAKAVVDNAFASVAATMCVGKTNCCFIEYFQQTGQISGDAGGRAGDERKAIQFAQSIVVAFIESAFMRRYEERIADCRLSSRIICC